MTDDTLPPGEFAGDMLRGAAEIAAFLYGDAKLRRKVYHLIETTQFPFFRLGTQIHARKSTIRKWIADQEARRLRRKDDP